MHSGASSICILCNKSLVNFSKEATLNGNLVGSDGLDRTTGPLQCKTPNRGV